MYCFLEFKLRYLKNLKLFFNQSKKELFEPIVLQKKKKKKKKPDGFLVLFKAFSLETDL